MTDVNVIGNTQMIKDRSLVTATTYTSGTVIGGLRDLDEAFRDSVASGHLGSIQMINYGGTAKTMAVFLFDAEPTASTTGDTSTFAIAAADREKLVGVVAIEATDYLVQSSVASAAPQFKPIQIEAGHLYAVLVARESIVISSTTQIHMRFGFIQD